MNTFFCAEESHQAGEDPIGNAWPAQFYVLVECPPPWAPNALDSKSVPSNLRALQEELDQSEIYVIFLLIYSDIKQENGTRCLIFRQKEGLADGYNAVEFHVPDINDVAPALRDYLAGKNLSNENQNRDILVCTHGSHDKCCAKYGQPFYRQALATVSDLSLGQVRIWQVSHIGEHRFAPTAIDFPEGRYYGRLDQTSFTSILRRTGDIQCLNRIYRGYCILPCQVQVLERELILRHGWDWFNYKIAGRIIEQNEDESFNHVELTFEKPDGSSGGYRADVLQDESKTLYLKGACSSTETEKIPQFYVKNIVSI